MKKLMRAAAIAGIATIALAGCSDAPEEETPAATTEETTEEAAEPTAEEIDYLACMVSDAGGFEDKSFNQSGAEGMRQAESELGVQTNLVESSAGTDYTPNITNLIAENCDIIFGVGFLLEDPIQAAAEANPETKFALIDSSFSAPDFSPVELDNGKPILFNTQEASFLAGYVAAGVSKTGKVATFGGIQLPSVSIFMDGFYDGVMEYNKDNDASVEVLGWDKEAQTGSFTGDFDNQANGQNLANGFIDQGADIIMPVAGPVGLGAAAAAQEAGDVYIVGVDADWYETASDYSDIILTSVLKQIGPAVFDTIQEGVNDSFTSAPYVGTLENEGVGIASFHDLEDMVPAEVSAKVEELKTMIISGDLVVESPSANAVS